MLLPSCTLLLMLQLLAFARAAGKRPNQVKVNYDGWKVVRVETGQELETVQKMLAPLDIDEPWNRNISQHMDIALKPCVIGNFTDLHLNHIVMHDDLGATIKKEMNMKPIKKTKGNKLLSIDYFDTYHTELDHRLFMEAIFKTFATHATKVRMGQTHEGRYMFALHLWGKGARQNNLPAIVIHGGSDARDWISTMAVEYIAYQLVKAYRGKDADPAIQKLFGRHEIVFVPMANPDGLIHSQTIDRLWLKNRQANPDSVCIGTNINRNWPYMWDANSLGASSDPCNINYRGAAPLDAVETQLLHKHIHPWTHGKATRGMAMYIDIHSYGQSISSPYGHSCTAVPAGRDAQHQNLTKSTADSLAKNLGTVYKHGRICETSYPITGGPVDYTLAKAKTKYSFLLETTDHDNQGFVVPPEHIRPIVIEAWHAVKHLMLNMDY